MANRRMGPVDTIWLNMDRPDNLMIIDSVMFFDGPMDWDRVRNVVQRRLVDVYPVFRQRPVQPLANLGSPHWGDVKDFDLERHTPQVTLARPDEAALQEYIEPWLSTPFDRSHPLWQFHLIDGGPDWSVIYCRFHHSLADGIALGEVLLSLTDAEPDDDLAPSTELAIRETGPSLLATAVQAATSAGSTAYSLASGTAHTLFDLPQLLDPRNAVQLLTQAVRTVQIADKLVLGPHPSGPFGGPPGLHKEAVWATPFPLEDVKRLGRSTRTTVNDVLLAAVAGALRSYLQTHGRLTDDISTMVPVNVRDLSKPLPKELGNQFALALFKYPTSEPDPLERIRTTHERMEVIKNSPESMLTFGLLAAIGWTGKELERFFVDFFASKAIGVTTNVPGPTTVRYFAGAELTGVLSWVPMSGQQTIGVSIFTYRGEVRVGFKVDSACIPDPEALTAAFDEEVEALLELGQNLPPSAGAVSV